MEFWNHGGLGYNITIEIFVFLARYFKHEAPIREHKEHKEA